MADAYQLPKVYPSVVHMLAAAARRAPEAVALVDDDRSLTYRQYRNAVSGLARQLIARNATGRPVIVLLGNAIDICIALFAVHAARAQAVPLNPLYTITELQQITADCQAHCLLCDAQISSETLQGLTQMIPHVLATADFADGFACWGKDDQDLPEPLPRGSDLASIQYTGGTTGLPKGVELTHQAVATNVSQREALLPTGEQAERLLCVAPLFHVYAISMCLHNMAYCCGTLVIMSRFDAARLLRTLETHAITLLAGNPTLFAGLMQDEGFEGTDFSALKLTYSGAAPLPAEVLSRWEAATGSPVLEGYGLSEAGPVVSFNPLEGLRKAGSVGIPVPGTEVEIVEGGEIRVRGAQVMQRYRNNPEETRQAIRQGWLYTGDLGKLDEDGYLFILGRQKDMLKVSGFSVFPREIEEVLHKHSDVIEAAVVGVPDARRGQLPVAYVVCSAPLSRETLLEHAQSHLASYKVPCEFWQVDALPKTGPGKVNKRDLERDAQVRVGQG